MKIKNFFKTNTNTSNNLYLSKKIINPFRDWLILIALFTVMIIYFVVFDSLTYNKIIKGEMYISVEKEELTFVKLNREELKSIIDKFEGKKDYVSKMKIELLSDPSM